MTRRRTFPPGVRVSRAWPAIVLLAGGGGCQGAASPHAESDASSAAATAQYQRTEITLRGPAAQVHAVTATSLAIVQSTTRGDGTASVVFRSFADADWTKDFSFTSAARSTPLTIRPWLCPRTPAAMHGSLEGLLATEERVLDVDDAGAFWTNGELGDHVLSACRYATGEASGGDLATFQDGPDLCSDPSRTGTRVEILDGQGNVVSHPTVCAAAFGRASSGAFDGEVRLELAKDADDASGVAFTVAINHCLPAGTQIPAVVAPADIQSSNCVDEAVSLTIGVTGVDKPTPYRVSAGSWTIESASPRRADAHTSQLDLTFTSRTGATYVVRGAVALPQLLF